jgi:hypothetical protein
VALRHHPRRIDLYPANTRIYNKVGNLAQQSNRFGKRLTCPELTEEIGSLGKTALRRWVALRHHPRCIGLYQRIKILTYSNHLSYPS